MKRSKFIEKIQNDLIEISQTSPNFANIRTDSEALDLILDLFETHGMLPPTVMFRATGEFSKIFAWESEDE